MFYLTKGIKVFSLIVSAVLKLHTDTGNAVPFDFSFCSGRHFMFEKCLIFNGFVSYSFKFVLLKLCAFDHGVDVGSETRRCNY